MTNEERDRLLAWLDEQIIHTEDKEQEAFSHNDADVANYFYGMKNAYRAVKAHLQAESESDEQV